MAPLSLSFLVCWHTGDFDYDAMVRCSYQCLFFFGVYQSKCNIYTQRSETWHTNRLVRNPFFYFYVFCFYVFFVVFFVDFFCIWEQQQSVSAPLVAPIYFATYIIAVFFILMNMMISIIIMGFEQAKSEQASKQNLYGQSFFFVSSLFFQFTNNVLFFFFSFLNCQLFFNFFFLLFFSFSCTTLW